MQFAQRQGQFDQSLACRLLFRDAKLIKRPIYTDYPFLFTDFGDDTNAILDCPTLHFAYWCLEQHHRLPLILDLMSRALEPAPILVSSQSCESQI